MRIELQEVQPFFAVFLMDRGEQHTAGLDAHHGTRQEIGDRGRQWIARDFSWKGVGAKMKVAYEWLLDLEDRPPWVRID